MQKPEILSSKETNKKNPGTLLLQNQARVCVFKPVSLHWVLSELEKEEKGMNSNNRIEEGRD